jgi:HAD superfamily hydrolase (TIGR01509 family)
MRFKAVFFDWDLTLVNSTRINRIVYRMICREVGEKPTEKGYRWFIGSDVTSIVSYFYNKYKRTYRGSRQKIKKLLENTYMTHLALIQVYDAGVLKELKKMRIKTAIITGNAELVVRAVARKNHMPYDALYGDEHRKGKSKVWAINQLLKRFKLKKKDVVYIGDHVNDIKEAHRAGIDVMILPRTYKRSYLKKFHPELYCPNLQCVVRTVR